MIITLLGMSGVGKTYWSKQLAGLGFQHICCDDLIGEQLGIAGIAHVADWMGQPYVAGYSQREEQYLNIERGVMLHILQKLNKKDNGPLVIDTTGSVIYAGTDICNQLQQHTTTVYIESSAYVRQQMLDRYLVDPKPVVWGTQFVQPLGRTKLAAITSCYPQLLEYRARQYAKYATVILPYDQTSQPSFTVNDFLDAILQHA